MPTNGKDGFDLPLTKAVTSLLSIPVIASGGAGNADHFFEVFDKAGADAALAASVFHYKEIELQDMKQHLKKRGVEIR